MWTATFLAYLEARTLLRQLFHVDAILILLWATEEAYCMRPTLFVPPSGFSTESFRKVR